MNTILYIVDLIITGYVIAAIPLAIWYLYNKKQREDTLKLVGISNIILAISAIIFLIPSIDTLVQTAYNGHYINTAARWSVLWGNNWFLLWAAILCKGLVPQIVWIRKLRFNILTSLFLLPFLTIEYYKLAAYNRFFQPKRDFIVSSWHLYIDGTFLLIASVSYFFLLTIIYFSTRKKLQL